MQIGARSPRFTFVASQRIASVETRFEFWRRLAADDFDRRRRRRWRSGRRIIERWRRQHGSNLLGETNGERPPRGVGEIKVRMRDVGGERHEFVGLRVDVRNHEQCGTVSTRQLAKRPHICTRVMAAAARLLTSTGTWS